MDLESRNMNAAAVGVAGAGAGRRSLHDERPAPRGEPDRRPNINLADRPMYDFRQLGSLMVTVPGTAAGAAPGGGGGGGGGVQSHVQDDAPPDPE